MHNTVKIYDDLFYVGGSDRRIALFESAFPVPRGVSYNSYLLLDEKTVLFDTVDSSVQDVFLENVSYLLAGRALDYLVIHHMEPDHSATVSRILSTYPNVTVVANSKTAAMLKNYISFEGKTLLVKEGDVLDTGKHAFQFIFAPLVHWPEVMLSFDKTTGTLFSADAFGTFGALAGSIFADEVHFERDFLDDARRYYFNIVGKFGVQVQNLLKKAAGLSINMICPLHGPVWRKDIAWYVDKYNTWSKYEAEEKGAVVFYASVYGHMQNAAEILCRMLREEGVDEVRAYDVSVTDQSVLLSEAFRYSHAVFASVTYNNGIFVNMERLLADLKAHNFQNRKYALLESGSWAPLAGGLMDAELSAMKNMTKLGEKSSFVAAVQDDTFLRELAKAVAQDYRNGN